MKCQKILEISRGTCPATVSTDGRTATALLSLAFIEEIFLDLDQRFNANVILGHHVYKTFWTTAIDSSEQSFHKRYSARSLVDFDRSRTLNSNHYRQCKWLFVVGVALTLSLLSTPPLLSTHRFAIESISTGAWRPEYTVCPPYTPCTFINYTVYHTQRWQTDKDAHHQPILLRMTREKWRDIWRTMAVL